MSWHRLPSGVPYFAPAGTDLPEGAVPIDEIVDPVEDFVAVGPEVAGDELGAQDGELGDGPGAGVEAGEDEGDAQVDGGEGS